MVLVVNEVVWMVTISVSVSLGTVTVVTVVGDEETSGIDAENSVDRDVEFIVDIAEVGSILM